MAIPADGHGTPASAVRPGSVIEEKATGWIGTAADGSTRAFHKEFGGGTGQGGEQPVQSTFAGDELEGP